MTKKIAMRRTGTSHKARISQAEQRRIVRWQGGTVVAKLKRALSDIAEALGQAERIRHGIIEKRV